MYYLLLFYLAHFIFDFSLQNEKDAITKYKSFSNLLSHTLFYSGSMSITVFLMSLDIFSSIKFWLITLILHTITDFISSKLTHNRFSIGKMYGATGFWSIIGIDQFLHIAQITITISYLFNTQ